MILPQSFFARSVLEVAPDLLGKYLVTSTGVYMITETEAYDGPEDKACHGSRGLTERTKIMFGPSGHWYVYLIYGMYWMLNVTTNEEGYPAAVLIRGIESYDGPGKLTKGLGIDKTVNGLPSSEATGLWIEDRGVVVTKDQIERTPRIGVEYADEWASKLYRYILTST